jgi:hypothetical protein
VLIVSWGNAAMKIDFGKSHPAVNIEDKRAFYEGFLRFSAVFIVLIALLLIWMAVFLV